MNARHVVRGVGFIFGLWLMMVTAQPVIGRVPAEQREVIYVVVLVLMAGAAFAWNRGLKTRNHTWTRIAVLLGVCGTWILLGVVTNSYLRRGFSQLGA